ncbi:MAG: DUF6263 family protein [Saprospiraceae bacterium]
MKISQVFLFIVSTVFLFSNCQSATKTESAVREGIKIGDVFNYRFHINNAGKVGVGAQEMNQVMEQKQDMGFVVKEKTQAGNDLIDFVMLHIELSMSNTVDGVPAGPAVAFNSSTDKAPENPGFMLLQGLIGHHNTITIAPNGAIISIDGLEEKIDSLFNKNTIPGAEQFMMQMKEGFNEEAMKIQLGELMNLSTLDKQIGDSWEQIVDIAVLPTFVNKLHKTFTLRDRKDGHAILDITGTVEVDPTGTVALGAGQFQYDVDVKFKGKIIVEEKNGWMISSNVEQIMSGKMTGTGPSMGGEQTTNFYSEMNAAIERF